MVRPYYEVSKACWLAHFRSAGEPSKLRLRPEGASEASLGQARDSGRRPRKTSKIECALKGHGNVSRKFQCPFRAPSFDAITQGGARCCELALG